jgi:hypothetical protein
MNPDPSKLRQQQDQTEQSSALRLPQEKQTAQEFTSAEEIIRFDAEQTLPPERIADRLKESIAHEPAPAKSWWQRLFCKGS